MGLHVHVRCNCLKDGEAAPHPLPDLLRFDENGEPYLAWEQGISDSQWALHEKWSEQGCPHMDGFLVFKHLGNIGSIAHVRAYVEPLAVTHFPLLSEMVIYLGTHGGDSISAHYAIVLLKEVRFLTEGTSDPNLKKFAADMIELCEASAATGNPIVF